MYISSTMTFQGSKVWRIGTQSSILKGRKDPVIDCTQHTVSSLTSSNLSWEFEVKERRSGSWDQSGLSLWRSNGWSGCWLPFFFLALCERKEETEAIRRPTIQEPPFIPDPWPADERSLKAGIGGGKETESLYHVRQLCDSL